MKSLLPEIVKSEGFCCEDLYLRVTRKYQSGLLSRYLGVHQRTVRVWKKLFKDGKTVCCGKNCLKNNPPEHRLENPKVRKRFQLGSKGPDNA